MNPEELRTLLAKEAESVGSQKALAAKIGISQQFLGDILRGNRDPGKKVLDHFGLVKEVRYICKTTGSPT